jgi:hypothetical protein
MAGSRNRVVALRPTRRNEVGIDAGGAATGVVGDPFGLAAGGSEALKGNWLVGDVVERDDVSCPDGSAEFEEPPAEDTGADVVAVVVVVVVVVGGAASTEMSVEMAARAAV